MKKVCFFVLAVFLIAGYSGFVRAEEVQKPVLEKPKVQSTEEAGADEKFVNPLFYERLVPISRGGRETFLTPTRLKYSNTLVYRSDDPHADGWSIEECEMLENEQDHIVLKCSFYNDLIDRVQTDLHTFRLEPCIEEREYCFESKWVVYEKVEGSRLTTSVIR